MGPVFIKLRSGFSPELHRSLCRGRWSWLVGSCCVLWG